MGKGKEITVEEKLRALYNLQLVDSKIDRIRDIRGELPLEVEDLDDEIKGLETRVEKLKSETVELEDSIKEKKNSIEESGKHIERYVEQQKNVRNNREYDSLSKEIEFQELEKELSEKRIREAGASIIQVKKTIEASELKLETRKSHLLHKREELDSILAETQREEDALVTRSKDLENSIEDRYVAAYKRIRKNVKNGLAVVSIERGASGGSFFTIPPQRQLEIATRKKIIIDEHSGRILVDPALATEEKEKMEKEFSSDF